MFAKVIIELLKHLFQNLTMNLHCEDSGNIDGDIDHTSIERSRVLNKTDVEAPPAYN